MGMDALVGVPLEEQRAVEGGEFEGVQDGGGVVGQHGGEREAGQSRGGQGCSLGEVVGVGKSLWKEGAQLTKKQCRRGGKVPFWGSIHANHCGWRE